MQADNHPFATLVLLLALCGCAIQKRSTVPDELKNIVDNAVSSVKTGKGTPDKLPEEPAPQS